MQPAHASIQQAQDWSTVRSLVVHKLLDIIHTQPVLQQEGHLQDIHGF